MDRILITVFACAQAKFVDVDFLNDWAARMRVRLPEHNYWLNMLELCRDLDCAETVVRDELRSLHIDVSEILPRLLVGFLYLRLNRGELSLLKFEGELTDVVDAYEVAGLDIDRARVALPKFESDLNFQGLLNKMAQESSDSFRLMEALPN